MICVQYFLVHVIFQLKSIKEITCICQLEYKLQASRDPPTLVVARFPALRAMLAESGYS